MSREAPRAWFAVDCAADQSPPLVRLRAAAGPQADIYYVRALAFCKLYAPAGDLETLWADLAAFVRWDGAPGELRDLFRAVGLALPPRDRLYLWYESNGWILRARAADAAKHRKLRAKADRHAKAERIRRARVHATDPRLDCRLVGRVTETSTGRHRDVTGTSPGRDPGPNPKKRTTGRKDRP